MEASASPSCVGWEMRCASDSVKDSPGSALNWPESGNAPLVTGLNCDQSTCESAGLNWLQSTSLIAQGPAARSGQRRVYRLARPVWCLPDADFRQRCCWCIPEMRYSSAFQRLASETWFVAGRLACQTFAKACLERLQQIRWAVPDRWPHPVVTAEYRSKFDSPKHLDL